MDESNYVDELSSDQLPIGQQNSNHRIFNTFSEGKEQLILAHLSY
jgi:hypothetical protein